VIRPRVRIPGYFFTIPLPSPLWNRRFGRFISISDTVAGRILRRSTKCLTPTTCFGSGPADIRIRIRINPKICIRIPNHFWLRFDALAEVCALWAQSRYNFIAVVLRLWGPLYLHCLHGDARHFGHLNRFLYLLTYTRTERAVQQLSL